MRKLCILLIVIVISGCSLFNKYEGFMSDAREQIRSEEYEKAIDSLDNALIEEPNSKDALSLKEMASERLQTQIEIKESEQFVSDTSTIHAELVKFADGINEEASNISINDAKKLMIKLNSVQENLNELNDRWGTSQKHSSSFDYLTGAADDLKQTFTAIVENIHEPIDYKGDYSRKNLVDNYLSSNDSSIRAKRYISDFRMKMESFESSLQK